MAQEIPPALTTHLAALEEALQLRLSSGPEALIANSRYVMGWQDPQGRVLETGGKRLRPALCLFAAGLFADDAAVAMPGAVAVELIHNFSLVHDEVQDHDAERHHRPTIWALHGEGQAINAGDFLVTRAFAALLDAPGPADRRLAALNVLNEAMARMIAGQWSDIDFESRENVSPEEYLAMIRGKTGALLGAPLAMGALLAGATAEQAVALQEWGETVGLAFQVQDDYLGIWGDPDLTGKSNTNDIVRKKKTLPIVFGLTNERNGVIAERYALADLDEGAVRDVVTELEACGAPGFVRDEGARLVDSADDMLSEFELPAASRESLREIGRYLVDRDR
ncbi:MAG: polyprenyl synthetase family protein [bacterium]